MDSDTRILIDKLREKLTGHYETDDYVDLQPNNVAQLVSDILYSNNLVISPIIIGLRNNNTPYICSMDGIGLIVL